MPKSDLFQLLISFDGKVWIKDWSKNIKDIKYALIDMYILIQICIFWYIYVYKWLTGSDGFLQCCRGRVGRPVAGGKSGSQHPTFFALAFHCLDFLDFFTYFRITAMTMEWNTLVPAMEWATLKWRPFIKFLEKASTFWESCWLCPLGRWILSRSIGKEYPKKEIRH